MSTIARASKVLVAFLLAWAVLGGLGQVSAQEATPAPTVAATATETPRSQFGETSDVTAIELDPPMAFVIVLVLLLLALIVLISLFRYLRESRQDYYGTIREFARKGIFFSPVLVSPTTTTERQEALDTTDTTSFGVVGPGLIAPGQEAGFTALRNGSRAENATWTLSSPAEAEIPAESATLNRTMGSSVVLTASKPGMYLLSAAYPGPPELVVRTAVTVATPSVTAEAFPELPFIGQGFGSIVGAVVVVAALVVLAATRAIDADVVGVILGALTGYLFGVGVTQSRT